VSQSGPHRYGSLQRDASHEEILPAVEERGCAKSQGRVVGNPELESALANGRILLPVALHPVDSEFLSLLDRYRPIVAEDSVGASSN
jgi:hypothetical protein